MLYEKILKRAPTGLGKSRRESYIIGNKWRKERPQAPVYIYRKGLLGYVLVDIKQYN
jgi:hypothetical protein